MKYFGKRTVKGIYFTFENLEAAYRKDTHFWHSLYHHLMMKGIRVILNRWDRPEPWAIVIENSKITSQDIVDMLENKGYIISKVVEKPVVEYYFGKMIFTKS